MPNDNADDVFFARRGFGQKIGFGTAPLLLVVDLINAFTDSSMMLGANMDEQVEYTNRLLDAFHERGLPVIFSTVMYEDTDLKDAGIWALKQKGVTTLRAGSPEVEVDGRLHRWQQDRILVKKYASCFFGTDLVPKLTTQGVDTLVIAGCTTSGCVRATAVDACQNGFRPMVVSEAVGDRSAAAHNQSLFDLNAKYADVVKAEEVTARLRAIG
ncbi:N-carbamoylsarcosine amidase [Mesorhizobium sp. L-8-10]|uniref:isochorismatase family protein n=1 Tax=Mesorhizobium sp. L-8-10 TaxID=2744523 RepID=UPI001926056A|nr:isochorismatase family protein [Mesorhizobium sp. L-8-10]BCH29369.1 N-carbamoylsarcosine amidase [Mesorhizobium sp. L-8-10]